MNIPRIFQSSVDPTQVSLFVTSIGKTGASIIVFLGVVGWVDPAIATQAWGNFVAEIITAIPVGYAVFQSAQAVWGLIRKISVRAVSIFTPAQQ